MGNTFGGGTTTTTSDSTNAPWSAQQPYLQQGFQQAQAIGQQRQDAGPYPGSYYSPINGTQQNAIQNAGDFAFNGGNINLAQTANTATTLQGAAPSYVQNAQNLAANGIAGPNQGYQSVLQNIAQNGGQSGVSNPLSQALNQAGVSGAQALQTGQQTLGQVQQAALQNQTGQTIANANQYANNGTLDAAIRAAQTGVNQTLSEQTLPGLNRQASMGGNLNSSRAGVAEAMANRDAATLNANIDSTMRQNAYQNGLSLSAQQQQAGFNAATSAASAGASTGNTASLGVGNLQQNQGQFNTNAQLSAANAGLGSDLGYQTANANTQLQANNQLGNAVNSGVNAANSATGQATNLFNLGSGAGGLAQQDQNAQIQAAQAKWNADNGGANQSYLNDYWNIVGHPTGTTATTTQTQQAPSNVGGTIAGLATLGATPLSAGGGFGSSLIGQAYNGIKSFF